MGLVCAYRRGIGNRTAVQGRCVPDASFAVLEHDLLQDGQGRRTEEGNRTMEEEQLNEVVSMLSVLAEAVLFGWSNVADIARQAAKMVHEIQDN